MKPHKHAELIKAWADGAEIEYRDRQAPWRSMPIHGDWEDFFEYRIKPQPKPDVVVEWLVEPREVTYFDHKVTCAKKNLRLTFDGETHELKLAEVI